jgi:hypothetical protein
MRHESWRHRNSGGETCLHIGCSLRGFPSGGQHPAKTNPAIIEEGAEKPIAMSLTSEFCFRILLSRIPFLGMLVSPLRTDCKSSKLRRSLSATKTKIFGVWEEP